MLLESPLHIAHGCCGGEPRLRGYRGFQVRVVAAGPLESGVRAGSLKSPRVNRSSTPVKQAGSTARASALGTSCSRLHQESASHRSLLPAWNFLPSASTTSRLSPASALSSTCPGLRVAAVARLGALDHSGRNTAQPVSVRRVVGNPDFASFLHDQLHCFLAHARVHFELGSHNP